MARRYLLAAFALLGLFLLSRGNSLQAQVVNFGTPVKSPFYDILPQLAEERGIWKEMGLTARWTAFRTGGEFYRAIFAGHVEMALTSAVGLITAETRLPAPATIMVADTGGRSLYMFWVRADSPIKGPRDMKGAKIGVVALNTLPHTIGLAAAKALGLEKDVKFVGMGGVRERLAAMRSGVIDVTIGSFDATVDLMFKGVVREVLDTTDYMPKEWIDRVYFVRRDVASRNPDLVKRGIKAMLTAADHLQQNPDWIGAFLVRAYGYSPQAAVQGQRGLIAFPYKESGKINPKAIENAANFLAEYGMAPKDKVTPIERWFTNALVD